MGLSTFSSLNTAARGLEAARQQIAVTAQNTANAGTVGYTRQSVGLSSLPGVQGGGLFPTPAGPGQGVQVTSVERSSSEILNRQVRTAVANSGYQQVVAETFSGIEDVFHEPGDHSVSSAVNAFHAAWQDVAANPQDTGAAAVLLETASSLAGRLRADVGRLEDQRTSTLTALDEDIEQVNALATRLAALNGSIRQATAAGGSANELLDARDQIGEQLAALTGGQLRPAANGTADFLVGGDALVSGETARQLERGADTQTGEPIASWSHRPGSAGVTGGSIAARVAVLSEDGPLARAAREYDALATTLAQTTNALHATALNASGEPGGNFFTFGEGRPAAALTVAVKDPSGVAFADPTVGGLDGSIADRISQLDAEVTAGWTSFVTATGAQSRTALDNLNLTVATEATARASQLSLSSVDRDEEAVNLVTFQHAYQASARVLTAVDELLDVLINRTGLVGR